MNRSTNQAGITPEPAAAQPEVAAPATLESSLPQEASPKNSTHTSTEAAPQNGVSKETSANGTSLSNGSKNGLNGHSNGHSLGSAFIQPPSKPPLKRRQTLWAALLGAGVVGAVGVGLWTHAQQTSNTKAPLLRATLGSGTPAGSSPSISSLFGATDSSSAPAATAPLFPGLGQLGGSGKGSATTQGKPSPFGVPGRTPGAEAKLSPAVQAAFASALAAQKAGHIDEAVQHYREVLQLKPNAVEAHANLAVLFAGQKQPERAIVQLEEARKLVPHEPTILFQLAQAQLQAKKPEQAVEPLQAVIKLDPKNATSQLLLAQVLSQLGRPTQALAAWERLCELDPKNSAAALAAGTMALEGTKQPERAIKWLRKAVALPPADPREPLLLGRALMAEHKPQQAAAALKQGFDQFPQTFELGTMLADARVASGDLNGAEGALREVIKRMPESQGKGVPSGQLHIALARMLATQRKFNPAQDELSEASRLLPHEADVKGLSVDMALRAGDWATVQKSLDEMISIDPKRFPARVLVARQAAGRKQLGQAEVQYAKYLAQRSDDTAIMAEHAVVLERLGRTDEADAQWKKAQILLPNSPVPGLQRARALQQAGRDERALDAYRFVLQNWPGDPNALLSAAQLEMKLDQPARAMARWRALIGVRPAFEPAYASLLEAARQVDQLPSALGFLKQQAARSPERGAIYEAVLNVHARIGQAREGRAWVSNMARLFPSARAPKRALAEFARRFPSLARDDIKPAPTATTPRTTPAPKATAPTPTATDASASDSTSDASPGETPASSNAPTGADKP